MLTEIPKTKAERARLQRTHFGCLAEVVRETGESFGFVRRVWIRENHKNDARRARVEQTILRVLNRRMAEIHEATNGNGNAA